ncbi:hypothetical protein JAAARDRAFT_48470 [Jaapia argillacea MUCL 33604]|uniref:Uncharacterized protein n=1 Tax=Jaapia argillacea MUCL 33604 TaxID=933084 RepID=A0A067PMY4_9AGAM|nr:hypothetical protein JAAARDRAFT_48470 [Jaapia argillacea MUCL 33604]
MYSPHYSRPPSSRTSGQQDPRRREAHQQPTQSPQIPSYETFPGGGFVATHPNQSHPTPRAIPRSYEGIEYGAHDAYLRSMNTRASNNVHSTPDREYSRRPYEPGQRANPPHPRHRNSIPQYKDRRAYLPSSPQAYGTRDDRDGRPPTEDGIAQDRLAQGAFWCAKQSPNSPQRRDYSSPHPGWDPPSNYDMRFEGERKPPKGVGQGSGRMDERYVKTNVAYSGSVREDPLGRGSRQGPSDRGYVGVLCFVEFRPSG